MNPPDSNFQGKARLVYTKYRRFFMAVVVEMLVGGRRRAEQSEGGLTDEPYTPCICKIILDAEVSEMDVLLPATPMKKLRIKDEPFGWLLLLGLVAGAVAIFAGYWVFSKTVYTNWKAGANVGETFGVLSSLFSVLAFAGVLFTIFQDRKSRSRSTKIEAYDALLRSIETQFRAAAHSGASVVAIGDLLAKQRLYSEELEMLITAKSTETLLTNEQIATAFAKIPWFTREDLLGRAPGLRNRLRRWSIISAEDLDAMVDDQEIRKAVRDLYVNELKRSNEAPFDPDALAIWGGMLYRQGVTADVLEHIRYNLSLSPEWKSKHPEPS